jgi:hypothetical protein
MTVSASAGSVMLGVTANTTCPIHRRTLCYIHLWISVVYITPGAMHNDWRDI